MTFIVWFFGVWSIIEGRFFTGMLLCIASCLV